MKSKPKKVDLAWCAGLFEGEGTITRLGTNRITLAISMTDYEPINKFRGLIGLGKLYGPYKYSNGKDGRERKFHKQYWKWQLADVSGVKMFWSFMGNLLSKRRRKRFIELFDAKVMPKARGLKTSTNLWEKNVAKTATRNR